MDYKCYALEEPPAYVNTELFEKAYINLLDSARVFFFFRYKFGFKLLKINTTVF